MEIRDRHNRMVLTRPNLYEYDKCIDKRCKTCPMMDKECVDEGNKYVFCCIYVMRCKICGLKYIGQTSKKINIRMNLHRHEVKNIDKKQDDKLNRLEIRHFKKHGFDNVEIGIIKVIPNNK